MSHSVESHLKLHTGDYDELILKLVPAYPKMRTVQLDLLGLSIPPTGGLVLDLGGGTGALAATIAERFPQALVQIWDVDPQMLRFARTRCADFGERIQYVERSFTGPLPACDAVAACLSLHHVKDLAVKGDIYRHIFEALRPSGIFVNADTSVPTSGLLRERAFRLWAESMRPHGIEEGEARAHFASWAAEDFYTPLSTEFRLLAEAGFSEPECFWREGAAAVFGGVRERATQAAP